MPASNEQLPDGVAGLVALARAAHCAGDRGLEESALNKLARDYGITVTFPCCASVDRELAKAGGRCDE